MAAIIFRGEIRVGVEVIIRNEHMRKYPDHNHKIFRVLSIDDENYCELEWINILSGDRIAYIPKAHLVIAK